MPLYEFECPEHGRFVKQMPLVYDHTAVCPVCGVKAVRKFSAVNTRRVVPLYLLDAAGNVLNKRADSSSSDDRNPNIPPDYPNLLEV